MPIRPLPSAGVPAAPAPILTPTRSSRRVADAAEPSALSTGPWPLLRATLALLCLALVVALLYVGEALLVPFALATLLAFVLDPLVTRLQRWRLPRAVAVVGVMVILAVAVAGASVFVAGQAVALGRDLPTYQNTVQKKLRALRQEMSGRGPLDDLSRMLEVVGGELEATRRALAQGAAPAGAPAQRVVLAPVEPTAMQSLRQLVEPLLGPVGTAGLVLVFLLFILLERHDLRDRLLRLVGGDLHRSTEALGEAGERVSRYLGMQVLVNLGYAVPLALGLWLLGVPGAVLFGVVGGLLRFVPYIGPLVAAFFPLAMAFAVDPGWHVLLSALAMVLALELVINNLVEPWLYGASTGLAPTAVVVSAAFWTLLWGPVGLILATPLTVCLVVMGRHLPRLAWLDVLLGSNPVFDPPTRLYQRLLDGEVEEAVELALGHARGNAFQAACNDTMLPVMALVADNQHRLASAEQRLRLVHGLGVVLQELQDHAQQHSPAQPLGQALGVGPDGTPATGPRSAAPGPTQPLAGAQVLCVGARTEVDALAAQLLVQVLGLHGLAASTLPAGALSAHRIESLAPGAAQVLVLCSLGRRPEAQLRFVCRRLRRLHPGLQPVLALWHGSAGAEALGPELADLPWAGSLDDAVLRVTAALRAQALSVAEPRFKAGAGSEAQAQTHTQVEAEVPALALAWQLPGGTAPALDATAAPLEGSNAAHDANATATAAAQAGAGSVQPAAAPNAPAERPDLSTGAAGPVARLAQPDAAAGPAGAEQAPDPALAPGSDPLALLNPLLDPACQAPLDHTVQRAAEVFDMPMACVALPVPGGQQWVASVGWPQACAPGQTLPADLGLLPQVLATGAAVQVADMARLPALAGQPLLVNAGVRALCAVPLRRPGGALLGALVVADRQARQLRGPELQLLQRLADELAALVPAGQHPGPGPAPGPGLGAGPGPAGALAADAPPALQRTSAAGRVQAWLVPAPPLRA